LKEGTGEEKLSGRVGGAVTLAVGMSKVFSEAWLNVQGSEAKMSDGIAKVFEVMPSLKKVMAYWYHFIIMFEALFIMTLLETGTRVARFVFQETLAAVNPRFTIGNKPHWLVNVSVSIAVCALWCSLVCIGKIDTLWTMLGIANQLLASIALAVGTTYLLLYAKKRIYALCTFLPFLFALVTTYWAGVERVQLWWTVECADSKEWFMTRLACIMAVIMLSLTIVITCNAVHRWWEILRGESIVQKTSCV
jgi:carbon starvation protein